MLFLKISTFYYGNGQCEKVPGHLVYYLTLTWTFLRGTYGP